MNRILPSVLLVELRNFFISLHREYALFHISAGVKNSKRKLDEHNYENRKKMLRFIVQKINRKKLQQRNAYPKPIRRILVTITKNKGNASRVSGKYIILLYLLHRPCFVITQIYLRTKIRNYFSWKPFKIFCIASGVFIGITKK